MFDAFYTPPQLAKMMVDAVPNGLNPQTIADFAAGEGILLDYALEEWPHARILANDLVMPTARKLKRIHPQWEISCSDFMMTESYSRAKYRKEIGNVDLILINPPFSERGRPLCKSSSDTNAFSSGTAVMFLYKSLSYLKNSGCLLALLPNSCLKSQRDEKGWSKIRSMFSVEILHANKNNVFKGVTASTSLVRIRHKNKRDNSSVKARSPKGEDLKVRIQRGIMQMHNLHRISRGKKFPLVHTTNLRCGSVIIDQNNRIQCHRVFCGPGVLFPRVGRVTHDKICILASDRKVVLSDCVLALECDSLEAAERLRTAIISSWNLFELAYSSTGAPYITLQRAQDAIAECLLASALHQNSCKREHRELISA